MDKVVLGFSGGVDSSVAALKLMERGFEVHGLFLDTGGVTRPAEVLASAEKLGFPVTIADAREALEEHVCRPFFAGYMRGETPNPCILCNPSVKFEFLCRHADAIGAEYIATGHYVRSENGALYMGRPANDQSYMLCRMKPEQARRFISPLGEYEKTEVRAMAEKYGVPAAKKPDSMEICFIPDKDYARWMDERGGTPGPGDFIYNGKAVAKHRGFHHYTLGQRRGLEFSAGRRVYVSEIRPETNEVVLSDGDGLFVDRLKAVDVNWLTDVPAEPFRCDVRIRHSKTVCPATVTPAGNDIIVDFDESVRAPTRGQSAVMYSSRRLLGGGFIV